MENPINEIATEPLISEVIAEQNEESEDETNNLNNISDDEDTPRIRSKKLVQRFSDSESDSKETSAVITQSDSDNESTIFKSVPQKSRIQKLKDSSDSDSSKSDDGSKNTEQQLRMKNKRDKLRSKFKNLVSSRDKGSNETNGQVNSESNGSENSNDEESSIENIKKKIKERMSSFKSSVCDPDTSDEEGELQKLVYKPKKVKKTKPTSPKPQRMSAKQAMENMNKIKSESNRMLREKEVSLPYHRPKALSLKDIMSRRQPALSADGKSLPIKMNENQLKQYAQMLEERQKKMMELLQSDSDDDENEQTPENGDKIVKNDANNTEIDTSDINTEKNDEIPATEVVTAESNTKDIFNDSDRNFDEVIEAHYNGNTVKTTQNNESSENIVNTDENKEPAENIEELDELKEQDSETNITLHYNESETSITDDKNNSTTETTAETTNTATNVDENDKSKDPKPNATNIECPPESFTEKDSQFISLHFDTEVTTNDISEVNKNINISEESEAIKASTTNNIIENNIVEEESINEVSKTSNIENENAEIIEAENKESNGDEAMDVDSFSDDDINMDDIDNIIENAEIFKEIEDKINSPLLIRDRPLNVKPTLTGAPGMIIDLDGSNASAPRKSGVQLLKERFTFFAKLKTPEEMEREREKRTIPGTLHLKLKQELEDKIAEQRSLEWNKRLEEEKQQQNELKELRGEVSDDENDIDKLEAKLEGEEVTKEAAESEREASESESEEELIENDCDMTDKPRSNNPMIADEAEESDCDEDGDGIVQDGDENVEDGDENEQDDDENELDDNEKDDEVGDGDDESSESDESESSDEEEQPKERKHRILKAFEDSDDETDINKVELEIETIKSKEISGSVENILESQGCSQDDVIQLAQRHKSASDDIFTTQESTSQVKDTPKDMESSGNDIDIGTQSFSIMDSTKESNVGLGLSSSGTLVEDDDGICKEDNLEAIGSVCYENLTQNLPPLPIPTTQGSQSQVIGENLLALCTGNFYDNQFVSQSDINIPPSEPSQDSFDDESQKELESSVDKDVLEHSKDKEVLETSKGTETEEKDEEISNTIELKKIVPKEVVDDNLKSILDELNDPEFESTKPNKFFPSKEQGDSLKKKFVIESDDESNDYVSEQKKKKRVKKKKLEKRALQISDDEEEEELDQGEEEYESEIEDDTERIVEYDSEENEIEHKPTSKKKPKIAGFFENEAELTSEDEWVGSGDEDEAGLDRMEREAGDDDTFHQGKLQRELGQIHMRDVLDQDKREVRIIQELLFEDGDLGDGSRQRKFRWRNNDGDEESGANFEGFMDTQEDEFESEEQWRKQRHERETFLREMQKKEDPNDILNVSVSRTSIIKANLNSKTMSSLLFELNHTTKTENKTINPVAAEKKTANDIPSPKKPFGVLQPNYQGSLLSRGQGALARLAAIATPLAVDDDAPKVGSLAPTSKRNFVFATLTPNEKGPKVTKRKAESNPSTPKLVKKMKTEEKQNVSKNSLLDHLKV